MAGSVNKVILVGNLGQDPEIKTFDNGGRIAQFSIATSETYKDQSGEKKTVTEWHRAVIRIPSLVDVAEKYLRKGMSLYAEGKLRTRQYQKDNVTHYVTEVVVEEFQMLTPKAQSSASVNSGEPVAVADDPAGDMPF